MNEELLGTQPSAARIIGGQMTSRQLKARRDSVEHGGRCPAAPAVLASSSTDSAATWTPAAASLALASILIA